MALFSRKSLLILSIFLTASSLLFPGIGIGFVATACWMILISNLIARPLASLFGSNKSSKSKDVSMVIAFNSQFKYQSSEKLTSAMVYLLGAYFFIASLRLIVFLSPLVINYDDEASIYLSLLKFTVLAEAVFSIIAGILFLFWIYRVSSNSHALYHAQEFEFSPKWNVASYFIPGINIYWPFKALSEIWKINIENSNANIIVNWWCCYVVATLAVKLGKDIQDSYMALAIIFIVVSFLCSCAAAALCIRIVKKICQSQYGKALSVTAL